MITSTDITQAIRISQALQEYFDKTREFKALRSAEAYEILVKKGLVEKDRHSGAKFRSFLSLLKSNNALNLIPQCRAVATQGKTTNWFFESTPGKTITAKNLKPISEVGKASALNTEKIKEQIEELPKRDISGLLPQELETRMNYPRAYEFWSTLEENLLLEVIKEIKDPFELSKLFKRQPSAIKLRLSEKHNIQI
jgi:hypothetical protein